MTADFAPSGGFAGGGLVEEAWPSEPKPDKNMLNLKYSVLFYVILKFDGTPMRLYSQGTLYASSEVAVRVATAVGVGGERVKLSPSLSMPVQNGV